jgi:hypothetical protein
MTKGEGHTSRALMIPFLAIHAKKGEKWAQSKRTAPPPISQNFKNSVLNIFHLVSHCVQKGEKIVFQNDTSKPSWTLRGGSHLGGVLFSQRESIWNEGRKFQIVKMLCKILFICLWQFAKELWKRFTKTLQKQNSWCKCSPKYYKKETIHAYLVKYLCWLNSKQPLHLHYAN